VTRLGDTKVITIVQLPAVTPSSATLADRLLAEDGVFHLLVVDQHGSVVVNRAKDDSVSDTFLNSFRDAAMRLSTIRSATHVDMDPVGTFRLALLEYDRVAMLLLPAEDRTVGIALLKEHATDAFLDRAKAIIARQ
jgi:hypothetical protein